MEPVTHFLTGACIGRAGLNRRTAYATLVGVLAAEAADMDVVWGLRGPVEELKHHRGITHTFLAAPLVAAAAVGVVWLVDRAWRTWCERESMAAWNRRNDPCPIHSANLAEWVGNPDLTNGADFETDLTSGPASIPSFNPSTVKGWGTGPLQVGKIHWGWLYLTALIAALSHLLLDWTNNYGVRPFYPFNPRWYAGSIVFIAEPVVWALLLMAVVMPWLFGLIGGEIGARKKEFRGQGWAIFALSGMVLLWGVRWAEHAQALALVANTQVASAPVTRVAMEPYPVNPFRWHAILETAEFYQTAEIDTLSGSIDSDAHRDLLYKPTDTAAVEAAKRTPLGQVYLDWGSWAVVRDMGQVSVPGLTPLQLTPNRPWTAVRFTDLRFAYSYLGSVKETGRTPLEGWVYIVDGREDAGEVMNGRAQR